MALRRRLLHANIRKVFAAFRSKTPVRRNFLSVVHFLFVFFLGPRPFPGQKNTNKKFFLSSLRCTSGSGRPRLWGVLLIGRGGVPLYYQHLTLRDGLMLRNFWQVAGSALGSGCVRWWVRSSGRSVSGAVLVAAFSSARVAGAFARRWAVQLPVVCKGCCVRRRGSFWCVSVPVASVPFSLSSF